MIEMGSIFVVCALLALSLARAIISLVGGRKPAGRDISTQASWVDCAPSRTPPARNRRRHTLGRWLVFHGGIK